ncbi:PREDICTED: growth arrest-specific protein 8 [Cyprinodon variegatus]|uniref:growth arrest-specific protein 8 n=1 Tax=Cyprinodon variegatus TaxID=28743 RepID=UPI0007427810|nr:PREDICTED: growth arrest-specific protein 8 [Cyprinodon variegatus]
MSQKNRKMKARKGKPSAVVDALSTEEMSKDQLAEHIIRLREELDREREERSYFQLERDKLHAVWEICKRKQVEIEAELRNSTWKKKEAEERHRVEINVYKQKLKHVLSEQHNAVFEVKADAISSSLLRQNSKSELKLRGKVLNLQAESRVKKFAEHNSIKQLKLKHQEELIKLSQEYKCKIQEMETRSFKRMHSLIETEEKKRRSAILDMEEQMRSRVESLMEEHDQALRKGEEYFSQILQKQQEDLNKWKEEVKKLQKEKAKHKKDLTARQQEKQNLKTLQEVRQRSSELHRQLQESKSCKDFMEKYRAEKKPVLNNLREVKVENELLLQAFEKLQQERDELLETHKENILGVQQRTSLKKLLLQRKLAALTETLEKKEAQLSTALCRNVSY